MTPWGVITIGASWEARMPGAPGLQGAEEAGGGKVRASLSQVGGQGLRRGNMGVIRYTPLSHPPQPWVTESLQITPHMCPLLSTSQAHPWSDHHSLSPRPPRAFLTADLAAYTLLHVLRKESS